MTSIPADVQTIPVERIFLDLENPRHEPYKNQAEVIDYLCNEEYVYQLAKDISKHGTNPLELFALIPLAGEKGKGKKVTATYKVAEGNRRMCAIMLLNDPDLAPANQRKEFRKLAEESAKISEVLAVIFNNKDQVDIWLDRIHNGLQGGVGRKTWNPEQKTRHFGDKKNILAQKILDYAEENNFISAQDRKGKITTVQRYLSNALLRESLGIDSSNLEDISRNRPKPDFDILLKKFVDDLLNNTVNSRANSTKITEYSRALGATAGLTGQRTATPESLSHEPITAADSKKRRLSPKKPTNPKKINYEVEIHTALKAIPSYKLEQIYYSLCSIDLEHHTPLLAVGSWVFFECLTAKAGSTTDFQSYLSHEKLTSLGFADKDYRKSLIQILKRISEHGNTTKHHDTSAYFDGKQLVNDLDSLKELIVKLAESAKKTTP